MAHMEIGALEELEILLPAADGVLRGGSEEEAAAVRDRLSLTLALLAQRMLDEDVRVRWFRGPVGRELTRLAGPVQIRGDSNGGAQSGIVPLGEAEIRLLRLLSEGLEQIGMNTALGAALIALGVAGVMYGPKLASRLGSLRTSVPAAPRPESLSAKEEYA